MIISKISVVDGSFTVRANKVAERLSASKSCGERIASSDLPGLAAAVTRAAGVNETHTVERPHSPAASHRTELKLLAE